MADWLGRRGRRRLPRRSERPHCTRHTARRSRGLAPAVLPCDSGAGVLYTYFPYYRLGFRANPFRVLDDDEWAEVAVLAPAVLTAASGASHLQLRAGRGRGKTSALLGLGAHFPRHGLRAAYEYLPPGETAWHTPPAGLDVLLLDEAD